MRRLVVLLGLVLALSVSAIGDARASTLLFADADTHAEHCGDEDGGASKGQGADVEKCCAPAVPALSAHTDLSSRSAAPSSASYQPLNTVAEQGRNWAADPPPPRAR